MASAAAAGLSEIVQKQSVEAFKLLDRGSTGMLTAYQIAVAMRSLGHDLADEELDEVIQEYDVHVRGGINLDDFLSLVAKKEENTAEYEKLVHAFQVLDKDGNGFVSKERLKELMTTVGDKYTEGEFDELISEVKISSDGMLDYRELVHLLLRRGD
ncbi:unnamed protein product [Vitrella brassicaformis CCMP3155]|uniref:Calmodulin n=2 Tax=Vitrella brassicaformis TaxID=1169539 RepID=A0A0G4GQF8_VITBC|nr:unnamed protein product [Vitrella brassicaformis CCMP3155]|eukprot:CEM32680.1 unnamed protein product [Vitrella brassicaformis CCMP3155]